MISVSRPIDGKLTKVILKFSPEQAPYIKTKPLHGSQKEVHEDETSYAVSIEVIPSYELESLILSYGNRSEAIEPKPLRETIQKRQTFTTDPCQLIN
jgi:predicted DNA-binding transcriptional regulator YafY